MNIFKFLFPYTESSQVRFQPETRFIRPEEIRLLSLKEKICFWEDFLSVRKAMRGNRIASLG